MSLRFQTPKQGEHGWYVCTLGAPTKYLHSDMVLRDSTHNDKDTTNYTGYYTTHQDAMDTLVEFIRNHL